MTNVQRQTLRDILVFSLLIAIGIVGIHEQLQWNFTPIAALAVFAGFYFSRLGVALLVPATVLVLSDVLFLAAYDSVIVMLAKYAVLTVPVLIGRLLRGNARGWHKAWRWGLAGLGPATLFFFVTNLAVWAFQSDYEQSLAGLALCYWKAVPFYRWMLAGDIFYLVVIFGCWSLAGARLRQPEHATQKVSANRLRLH